MRAARAVALLAALTGCVAAAAYASAPRGPTAATPGAGRERSAGLPQPTLAQHPRRLAVSASAEFAFRAPGRQRFQCQLDARPWRPCHSPVTFTGLALGAHRFGVRRAGPGGTHGRPARFRWRVLEPRDFSIVPRFADLGELYPGAPPQPLPVTISNPNPVPIFVTDLSVATSAGAPGCASAGNLALTAAGVSSAAPLEVPADGSANLPAPGMAAPEIQLRDLPVDQDACQGATFPLSFSGSARG